MNGAVLAAGGAVLLLLWFFGRRGAEGPSGTFDSAREEGALGRYEAEQWRRTQTSRTGNAVLAGVAGGAAAGMFLGPVGAWVGGVVGFVVAALDTIFHDDTASVRLRQLIADDARSAGYAGTRAQIDSVQFRQMLATEPGWFYVERSSGRVALRVAGVEVVRSGSGRTSSSALVPRIQWTNREQRSSVPFAFYTTSTLFNFTADGGSVRRVRGSDLDARARTAVEGDIHPLLGPAGQNEQGQPVWFRVHVPVYRARRAASGVPVDGSRRWVPLLSDPEALFPLAARWWDRETSVSWPQED